MKKTLLLLPALMLAGCQMLNYQEPGGEDTATVVFTGNEAAQPVVCVAGRGFKDTKTSLAVKPWDTNAFDERSLAAMLLPYLVQSDARCHWPTCRPNCLFPDGPPSPLVY